MLQNIKNFLDTSFQTHGRWLKPLLVVGILMSLGAGVALYYYLGAYNHTLQPGFIAESSKETPIVDNPLTLKDETKKEGSDQTKPNTSSGTTTPGTTKPRTGTSGSKPSTSGGSSSGGSSSPSPATRDPLKWPFASSSIWNMPIGSNAQYVDANLPTITASYSSDGEWTPIHYPDPDRIVMQPTAPMTPIYYNSVGWNGGDRCAIQGAAIFTVPIPTSYVVPNSGHNNGAAFLMPDRRTIIQTQPFTRCLAGGPATSWTTHHPNVDIYGGGIEGAHGGSGMSALGGALRMGELRPGQSTGPRHALKINLVAEKELYKCTSDPQCHRWPALTSDAGSVGWYGTATNNNNTAMKMGALLAIPASVNINNLGLETTPAKLLAWTIQNYGMYIVDHGGPSISVEDGPDGSFNNQFKADWGYDMEVRVRDNSAWGRDFNRLREALYVVNNNSSSSIGGGGIPRQPLAPEIRP